MSLPNMAIVFAQSDNQYKRWFLKVDFVPTPLHTEIAVTHLVTLHNFKYTPDFLFTGESHNFWELVFVKSGSVGVMAASHGFTLNSGEAIFHKPNEYHNIWANGDAADVVVVSFISHSPAMKFFEGRLARLSDYEASILDRILDEGSALFDEPPDILYQTRLSKKTDARFGSEQLIRMYLEQLLIRIIQNGATIERDARRAEGATVKNNRLITDSIIQLLTERVFGSITLDEVCESVYFSKSHIKTLFKQNTGYSIMDYYIRLKLERAKILIAEGTYSFSDIAELLHFGSIHYFSRVFKAKTGLTPTEYKRQSVNN